MNGQRQCDTSPADISRHLRDGRHELEKIMVDAGQVLVKYDQKTYSHAKNKDKYRGGNPLPVCLHALPPS